MFQITVTSMDAVIKNTLTLALTILCNLMQS